MPVIGAVADDLTGATTTGVLLARSHAKTAVFFNEEAAIRAEGSSGMDAILISSNSRPLPPDEAYSKVKEATIALKQMGVQFFSKRIDTTCRGGIGFEIDAMLDQLSEDAVAVVVPAMPQSRRILVGGFSVIDGVALVRTPVAQDVRTPVRENYIPSLLASQTKRKVDLISLEHVLDGHEAIERAMRESIEKGAGVIVVDGITIEDVEEIARATVALNRTVLAVDPGPFTAKLAYVREQIGIEQANVSKEPPVEGKTVLICAGSATPVTKRQMEVLCEEEGDKVLHIEVDPVKLIDGGKTAYAETDRAIEQAEKYFRNGTVPKAILFETALHGSLLNLEDEERKRGYENGEAANRINGGLGIIIAELLRKEGTEKIAALYCTGGDTMVYVCRALGVECLQVVDYVIPQTDLSRLVGAYDGLPVVGKGGLTGNDHTAVDIVNRLLKEAARKDY